MIVIDEIDALCRRRGAESSANAHRDAVVNQLLSKIDGLEAQRNVLIIGTVSPRGVGGWVGGGGVRSAKRTRHCLSTVVPTRRSLATAKSTATYKDEPH